MLPEGRTRLVTGARRSTGPSRGPEAEGQHAHHGDADGPAAERDHAGGTPRVLTPGPGLRVVPGPGVQGPAPEERALEVGRRRAGGRGEPGQPGLHPALALDLVATGVADVHVRPGALGLVGREPAVEEGADPGSEVAHHAPLPRPLSTASPAGPAYRARPSTGARWARAVRSIARPRWMRERTVPSFAPEDLGDLLVGEPLDVAEHDGGPEVGRQGGQRALDVVVEGLVGVRRVRRRQRAGQPVRALVGEGVEADPLLAARLVEEEVGGDPVQPALEGARRVRRQRAEDADEDLLGEVLGVVPVAGQAVGEPVDAVGVLLDDLVPAWARPRERRPPWRPPGSPCRAATAPGNRTAS